MNEPKISVIIPYFRSMDTLQQCLDSVLAQTHTNLEIVCVGDGIDDPSHAIVENYASRFPGKVIQIIQTQDTSSQGKGPGRARNRGINDCMGEYITFVDADDTVDRNYVHALLVALQRHNVDFSCCGFDRIDGHSHTVMAHENVCTTEKVIHLNSNTYEEAAFLYPAGWGKLYRRALLKTVRFSERLPNAGEDVVFSLSVRICAGSYVLIPERLYQYTMFNTGMTRNYTHANLDAFHSIILEVNKFAENTAKPENYMGMLTLGAFIHAGIALVHRLTLYGAVSYEESISRSRSFLDTYYPGWRKISPFPGGHCTLHGLAVYMVKVLYIYGGAALFMRIYNACIRLSGKDFK